ncbi:MAG: hypothetical protein LBR07_01265 [Puniceicoccales bacterium]|jgi:hypothetical protein|nr:hypothetical protein [Puniceicoccales bacterium]
MKFFEGDIDHLGETLNETVKKGVVDLQAGLAENIRLASGELRENIAQIGDRLDTALDKAEQGLKSSVESASTALGENIRALSDAVTDHRNLASDNIKSLIDYAAERFDKTIEHRLGETVATISKVVDEKVATMRRELADAAREQKRTWLRNILISLGATLFVAAIAVTIKAASPKGAGDAFDLLLVFRVAIGAFAVAGTVSFVWRVVMRWLRLNPAQRDLSSVLAGDTGVFSPRGVLAHLALLVAGAALWAVLVLKPEWLGLGR